MPLARTATVVLRVVQIRIKTRSSLITLIVTIIATAIITIIATAIITTTIAIAVAIAIALAIAVAAAVAIALAMAAREAKGGWVGYPPTQATGWVTQQRLIEKKEHLTLDGLNKIRQIKSGLNKGRREIKI